MGLLDGLKSAFGGKRLDVKARFELLRAAISGTMSEVYMARDRQTDQIVAIKLLDPKKLAFYESRFRGLDKPSEGEIALRFDHPYIVKTLECGRTTEDRQYLVMDFIKGAGMNSILLMKEDILFGGRLIYLRQVAEALSAVHQAGFIHRDVCPRNLLFTGDGKTLILTDFGLSVPAEGHFLDPGNRTGTPNYMAPELVRRFPTDQRLDVFSFGVTAYEICCKRLPWTGGSGGVIGMAAMAAMTHDQPGTPITNYNTRINRTLAKAIHWCIEPDPKERCPTMKDFLRMIHKVEWEREE